MHARTPRSIPGQVRDEASPNQEMEWRFFRSLSVSHNRNYFRVEVSLQPRGIPRDYGVRRNVFRDHRPGADDCVFSNRHVAKNSRPGPDRCAFLDPRALNLPIAFRLELTLPYRCARIRIVDEGDAMSDEDVIFNGHGVTFINDSYPRATIGEGQLQTESDWKVERTLVKKGASIGSGSTVLCNVTIGENAIVGAGSDRK